MTCYSHSRLSTFESCRYKYKLQYIDKIKVDVPTTIEAFMGDLVHRMLEKLYSDLKFHKLNKLKELLVFFKETWDKEFTSDILIAKSSFSADNYFKMGKKYITDYYKQYKPFKQMTILGLETQDRMTLPDGNQYHVRIDKLGCINDTYYVCDYKTNSRMKDQEEADSDRQLAMYSIWVKDKFKDAKKVILLWHMLAFNKEAISSRTDEQLAKLQSETVALIKEVENCKEFPTNVTSLCNYCVYKSICPSFKHELELETKDVVAFKEDDGLKLVDNYSSLYEQSAKIESELSLLKERLIAFASSKGIDVVYGSNKKASVKSYESLSLPPKDERTKVDLLIKENKLWDELSELDTHKLTKLFKDEKLPKDLLIKLNDFFSKKKGYRLSLSKRKDGDDN